MLCSKSMHWIWVVSAVFATDGTGITLSGVIDQTAYKGQSFRGMMNFSDPAIRSLCPSF